MRFVCVFVHDACIHKYKVNNKYIHRQFLLDEALWKSIDFSIMVSVLKSYQNIGGKVILKIDSNTLHFLFLRHITSA